MGKVSKLSEFVVRINDSYRFSRDQLGISNRTVLTLELSTQESYKVTSILSKMLNSEITFLSHKFLTDDLVFIFVFENESLDEKAAIHTIKSAINLLIKDSPSFIGSDKNYSIFKNHSEEIFTSSAAK